MNLPFSADELSNHIQDTLEHSKSLLETLKQEQEALKSRDVKTIEILLEEKTKLLLFLEQSANTRTQWARVMNISVQDESWNQFLTTLDKPVLTKTWLQLKKTTDECKKQNDINGKLLVSGQKSLGRLLDVFRGKTANPYLYNANGSSTNSANSNKVGEA